MYMSEDYFKVSYYDMIFLGIFINLVVIVYQLFIIDYIFLLYFVMLFIFEIVFLNVFIGIVKVEVNI